MQATSPSNGSGRARLVIERYVALGDSFTGGAEGHSTPLWADELAESLRTVNPELDYHNLAAHGVPSANVAEHQLEPAIAVAPDLVTVICGANDVLLSVRPDIGTYAATFDQVLTRLQRELPRAVVVTATTPDLSRFMRLRPRTRERVNRGMHQLNEATRSVARRHRVHCMEWARHPEADSRDSFAGDGFHPSYDGSRRAAEEVIRALSELGVEVDGELAPVPVGRAS